MSASRTTVLARSQPYVCVRMDRCHDRQVTAEVWLEGTQTDCEDAVTNAPRTATDNWLVMTWREWDELQRLAKPGPFLAETTRSAWWRGFFTGALVAATVAALAVVGSSHVGAG